MHVLSATLRDALAKLRANERGSADTRGVARDSVTHAENYKDVRAEFQKTTDDTSGIQVWESLGGIAGGSVGRFATMDVEKQPGY